MDLMKNFYALVLSGTLLVSSMSANASCPESCNANDNACTTALLACVDEKNADAAMSAIAAVAVVGGAAIWWLANRDSSTEEQSLMRLHEASLGRGLRITDFEKPYRISVLPTAPNNVALEKDVGFLFPMKDLQQRESIRLIEAELSFE